MAQYEHKKKIIKNKLVKWAYYRPRLFQYEAAIKSSFPNSILLLRVLDGEVSFSFSYRGI